MELFDPPAENKTHQAAALGINNRRSGRHSSTARRAATPQQQCACTNTHRKCCDRSVAEVVGQLQRGAVHVLPEQDLHSHSHGSDRPNANQQYADVQAADGEGCAARAGGGCGWGGHQDECEVHEMAQQRKDGRVEAQAILLMPQDLDARVQGAGFRVLSTATARLWLLQKAEPPAMVIVTFAADDPKLGGAGCNTGNRVSGMDQKGGALKGVAEG
jgi:hypothetical protein